MATGARARVDGDVLFHYQPVLYELADAHSFEKAGFYLKAGLT